MRCTTGLCPEVHNLSAARCTVVRVWVLGVIFGIIVMVIGGWMIWLRLENAAQTEVLSNEYGALRSPYPGVPVLLVGIVIVLLSAILFRNAGGDGGEHIAATSPQLVRTPSNTPTTPEASSTPPPTADSPTPTDTPEAVPTHGPWVGSENGVQLVVSGVEYARQQNNRLRIDLKLENGSGDDIELDEHSFLAVDDQDRNYRGDYDDNNSDWEAENTLSAGERRDGYIVLADKLAPDLERLRIEFNVSQYCCSGQYFTISTIVKVPPRP